MPCRQARTAPCALMVALCEKKGTILTKKERNVDPSSLTLSISSGRRPVAPSTLCWHQCVSTCRLVELSCRSASHTEHAGTPWRPTEPRHWQRAGKELVHAELSQIWEFVAIFPRHAVRRDCRREHVRPLRSGFVATSRWRVPRSLRRALIKPCPR